MQSHFYMEPGFRLHPMYGLLWSRTGLVSVCSDYIGMDASTSMQKGKLTTKKNTKLMTGLNFMYEDLCITT